MTRERNRTSGPETGEGGTNALATGADTPDTEQATETPAPAPVTENTEPVDVPLELGKGGCYVIGEDGRRVRVSA